MRCDVFVYTEYTHKSISIHAPRVRCDFIKFFIFDLLCYFNPRTSCEVRLCVQLRQYITNSYFNPRTSCEVRQELPNEEPEGDCISIHAPRVRCDFRERGVKCMRRNFNPRTSCEVRHIIFKPQFLRIINFNPRTSCEVRPTEWFTNLSPEAISIHAPRVRCDVSSAFLQSPDCDFNPRTSCEVRQ